MARYRPFANWVNQDLVLFHGTLDVHEAAVLGGVNVAAGSAFTDFGRGFYTTTLERQARLWALQLAQQTGRGPAVIRFIVSRKALAGLDCLWFVRGHYDAHDFWNFVNHCRRGGAHLRGGGSWYDAVVGPVARKPASLRKTLFSFDQVSFHTNRSAALLDNCLQAGLASFP